MEGNDVRVVFTVREGGPERLLADAAVVFESGRLAGLQLVGFSIWQGTDGDAYCTVPSRAFGAGYDRRFFDYLRVVGSDQSKLVNFKAWMLEEFHKAAKK